MKEFSGEDGRLVGVVLRTGETLEADVCLVGIGSTPTSGWLAGSGLNISARGEVVVDKVGMGEEREGYRQHVTSLSLINIYLTSSISSSSSPPSSSPFPP